MKRQKPAPPLRARWWQPARPPAVVWVAVTACLVACWVATEADGAPNSSTRAGKDSDWCTPLREAVFHNLLAKEKHDSFAWPRPALCNEPSIRHLMVASGTGCRQNSSITDLWSRVCGIKQPRGGSGLNTVPSGATDENRLKKVTNLMKKVKCMPRFVLEDVKQESGEDHLIFEPCQVKVKRCSGCCNNDDTVCLPTRNQTKHVTVLRMMKYGSLQNFNNSSLADERLFVKKQIVHHTRCACQCKVQATHCTNSQQHDPSICRCHCPESIRRSCDGANKHFNTAACACECRERKICSTGMTFDPETCRCVWKGSG